MDNQGDKMKIHHMGIIVESIDKSIDIYKQLGYSQISEIFIDNIQHIKIVFLKSKDNTQTIELIESLGNISSIHNFGTGYHHICYDVSDIQDYTSYFKTLKIGKIFMKPMIASALENRQVVFAYLANGTFVEFVIK